MGYIGFNTSSFIYRTTLEFKSKIRFYIITYLSWDLSTGIAWLLRFYILKHNGLVFQAQVAYLIPIFGVILGFLILNEAITSKVIIALIAVIIGIYIVKKGSKIKLV